MHPLPTSEGVQQVVVAIHKQVGLATKRTFLRKMLTGEPRDLGSGNLLNLHSNVVSADWSYFPVQVHVTLSIWQVCVSYISVYFILIPGSAGTIYHYVKCIVFSYIKQELKTPLILLYLLKAP